VPGNGSFAYSKSDEAWRGRPPEDFDALSLEHVPATFQHARVSVADTLHPGFDVVEWHRGIPVEVLICVLAVPGAHLRRHDTAQSSGQQVRARAAQFVRAYGRLIKHVFDRTETGKSHR
jgi:hypothetical protein